MVGASSLWGEFLPVLWSRVWLPHIAFCSVSAGPHVLLELPEFERPYTCHSGTCAACAKACLPLVCRSWPWVKRHAAQKKADRNAV